MNAEGNRLTQRDTDKDRWTQRGFKYTDVTQKIIGAALNVHNALGFGFTEKVYENAMAIELRDVGLTVVQQAPVRVLYQGQGVGDYVADFLVEEKVVVELKAVETLDKAHEVQLVNYLKATDMEVGLLINFGKSLAVKRKVFTRKESSA